MSEAPVRPTTILIGALGGEGGGVLSKWIVDAAENQDLWVQSTSIPGVAQRTGATTYYIEVATRTADGAAPVMSLTPSPGDVDAVITSEPVEAARAIQNGFVTPQRTTLIASTHRIYTIGEKSALGDGRYDPGRFVKAAEALSARRIMFDMSRLAHRSGSVINAVLLGALAAAAIVPIPRTAFEDAIRGSGIMVAQNLRGFAAGYDAVTGAVPAEPEAVAPVPAEPAAALAERVERGFPPTTHDILRAGVARVADYQDARYAGLYLDRLQPVLTLDRMHGGAGRGFALTAETGRHLALLMSFEDLIRVADLKTRRQRFTRVRLEVGAGRHEPVRITEFLKPGVEEMASVLPAWLGSRLMAVAERRGLRLNVGLRVATTSVSGFFLMWLMARLRRWRRGMYRFRQEQARIENWLDRVVSAARLDYDLGLEVAECARLVKGYGDTHRRGARNLALVLDAVGELAEAPDAAARLARLREAALADPEGDALDRALDEMRASSAAEAVRTPATAVAE